MKYLVLIIILLLLSLYLLYIKVNYKKEDFFTKTKSNVLYLEDLKNGKINNTDDVSLKILNVLEETVIKDTINVSKKLKVNKDLNVIYQSNCLNQTVNGTQTIGGNQTINNCQEIAGSETVEGIIKTTNLVLNPSSKFNLLPKGIILMWYGSQESIPNGWVICNGTNETPDLRNRFILGASSKYLLNKTGGENSVKLTVDQIPNHSHPIHDHFKTITSTWSSDWTGSCRSCTLSWGSGPSYATCHFDGRTGKTGSDVPHENRPPYYALHFIMKL